MAIPPNRPGTSYNNFNAEFPLQQNGPKQTMMPANSFPNLQPPNIPHNASAPSLVSMQQPQSFHAPFADTKGGTGSYIPPIGGLSNMHISSTPPPVLNPSSGKFKFFKIIKIIYVYIDFVEQDTF